MSVLEKPSSINCRGAGLPARHYLVSVALLSRVIVLRLVFCLVLTNVRLPAVAKPYHVDYQGDNSDWWTSEQMLHHVPKAVIQAREPAASNFRVAGIELGNDEFSSAASRFGKAPIVERRSPKGHLRRQVCYASHQVSGRIFLIFEESFMEYSAYVFAEGPDWDGRQFCKEVRSPAAAFGTSSGLRVGQPAAGVLAVLGKPSFRDSDSLFYSFSVSGKKATREDLAEARKAHAELSQRELEEEFGTYDLEAAIYVRFVKSQLSYLSVSRSETN